MTDRLDDIAARINAHLKRWEDDPVINAIPDGRTTRPFFHAWAQRNGRYVAISYVSYQLTTHMSKAEAIKYLEWIEAGNVGTHYQMEREARDD